MPEPRWTAKLPERIGCLAWSPGGDLLAVASLNELQLHNLASRTIREMRFDKTGTIWALASSVMGDWFMCRGNSVSRITAFGDMTDLLPTHPTRVYTCACSPDGAYLATGSADQNVRIWEPSRFRGPTELRFHARPIYSIAWSPDGRYLASASKDTSVAVCEPLTGQLVGKLTGHRSWVASVAWSPDSTLLASCSLDETIRIWDSRAERPFTNTVTLEGHTDAVYSVTFSPDGSILASKSADSTIRFWDTATWQPVGVFPQPTTDYGYYWAAGPAFHPSGNAIAVLGESDREVQVIDLDFAAMRRSKTPSAVIYADAKVALVGDAGAGKSALAMALAGESFRETTTTHGRSIRSLGVQDTKLDDGTRELREVLLWDLAGQAEYSLIDLLYLGRVDVAVVVFDPRRNDIRSLQDWVRKLRQHAEKNGSFSPPIVLVAAKGDLPTVDSDALARFSRSVNLQPPMIVSSRTGQGIAALREHIEHAINWSAIPRITSTELLQAIRTFLVEEKSSGRLMSTLDELYRAFTRRNYEPSPDTRASFETAIRLLESTGLIATIRSGSLVLIQPEILTNYASAVLSAAREHPGGLGVLNQKHLLEGQLISRFVDRIPDPEQERLILSATIDELLRLELAIRDGSSESALLIFPSAVQREHDEEEGTSPPKFVSYRFSGPIDSIFATLVVSIELGKMFRRTAIWRHAAEYAAPDGKVCGFRMGELGDGLVDLEIYSTSSEETRTLFEQFIQTHISKHAATGSVERMTVIICPTCAYEFTNDLLQRRLARGFDHAICPVCGTRIPLPSGRFDAPPSLSPELERRTELERERTAARDRLQAKIAAGEFDVYFSYRDEDRKLVVHIANRLRDVGILPWIDFEQLRPGQDWAVVMSQQLTRTKAFVSFIGASGIGPHQKDELAGILHHSSIPIIPVILQTAPDPPDIPQPLAQRQWVDFRRTDPDPMEVLIWGITGVRGGVTSSAAKPDEPPAAPALESALEAAERRGDWAAARQFHIEIALQNTQTDRSKSVDHATRALWIADDPAKLDGTGMDEPIDMLLALAPSDLMNWIAECDHRLAAVQILREIAESGSPAAKRILNHAGIDEWRSWFKQPDSSTVAKLPHGSSGWPSFRVRSLRLHNIKSFETFSCDLVDEHGRPRPMSAFVGDNATGKSTLLQCIALACLGTSFANKIEGISAQTLLRNGKNGGAIQLDLELAIDPEASQHEVMTIRLGIGLDPTRKDFYELHPSQMLDGDVNHMEAWNMLRGATGLRWGFCAGYGAFRALRERRETLASSATTSLELDRVSSLFQPQATLLEPAILEALFQADISMLSRSPVTIPLGVRDRILELFRDNIPGIDVREQEGKLRLVEIHSGVSSASALSDGCNSMIGLLAHVIRHALEITDWVRDPRTAEGIVLIDEVDLHLHPKWQRVALPQLEKAFPKLQFIVTTHSPLVLGGVPDGIVNILQRDDEGRTELVSGPSVKGWRVDQLLTGIHFEVGSPYDVATDQLSEEYGRRLEQYGPDHPLVKETEERLDSRMGQQHGSTPLDREIWKLLDEFVEHRWSQRTAEDRSRAKAKMWEVLNN